MSSVIFWKKTTISYIMTSQHFATEKEQILLGKLRAKKIQFIIMEG